MQARETLPPNLTIPILGHVVVKTAAGRLEQRFAKELDWLRNIFGAGVVAASLPRLNEIFHRTENWWEDNLRRIGDCAIRYLVIAEAPPWHEDGQVAYVYNPDSVLKGRHPVAAIYEAFFASKIGKAEYTNALDKIAKKGVLIVDSLPFAMKYSPYGRRRKDYSNLVRDCSGSYLSPRLRDPRVKWSGNLQIAFTVKRNACELMESLQYNVPFGEGGQQVGVSRRNIVADGSGYPSDTKIRKVFDLESRKAY